MALVKCPECGKEISDLSKRCIYCGYPLSGAALLKDVLSETYKKGIDKCEAWVNEVADGRNRMSVPKAGKYEKQMLYCTTCGRPMPAEATVCERCGERFELEEQGGFHWGKWMIPVVCCVILMAIILVILPWDNDEDAYSVYEPEYVGDIYEYQEALCDTCDYVLCRGTDTSGNTYELVANQTESALGYEITVGVIKNNEWIYPLSTDFPFLDKDDGLFHVSVSLAGESGTSLEQVNSVIQSIYFIDSGAFLMESRKANSSWFSSDYHNMIIFSCNSLKSYTVDCNEYNLLYRYSKATFSYGEVESYGRINTQIILYSATDASNRNSTDSEDWYYDWFLLDTQTPEITTLAANVNGVHPRSSLSEGLIFASDQCFYNTNLKKVIDLSAYEIDMWYAGDIYFVNGTCEFTAENELGTEFLITIDKSGNVLSEVEKAD